METRKKTRKKKFKSKIQLLLAVITSQDCFPLFEEGEIQLVSGDLLKAVYALRKEPVKKKIKWAAAAAQASQRG